MARHHARLKLPVLLLWLTAPVHAQSLAPAPQAARRDTSIYFAAPVTVSALRIQTNAGGSSAVAAVLDSARVPPAPTLEQVTREMPLVVIRANSRGEAQPALRGGEDRQIAVLVDGVPITLGWDARTDLAVVPLTAARDVTLHRGLATLLTGPNALGGALEVDIARGKRANAAPTPLLLDAGIDHTGAGSASVVGGYQSAGPGTWTLRAGAGFRGSDGFALAHGLDSDPATRDRYTKDGDLRLNSDVQALDGFLSVRRLAASGAWTSLTTAGYHTERGVPPEAHTTEPRLWRYPLQERVIGALAGGTGMHNTAWGRGDLEASFGVDAGRTNIDAYDDLDYDTVVDWEHDKDLTLTGRLLGDHTLGERGDIRTAFTFADIAHKEVLGTDPEQRYRQRLWSLAGETDWRLPWKTPVRFSIGAAADGADTPESGDKPPLGTLWDWGGRMGATALLGDGRIAVHGAGGRRARFPALRELYSGALGRFLPNPDLRPEVQWAAEAGLTVRHPRAKLQAVGFYQMLEDGIARVSVSNPTGNKYQRVNQGRTTGFGLELVAESALRVVRYGGDLTLQRVRAEDDSELEYEPTLHGSAWVDAPLVWQTHLGVEARGVSEQRYIDIDSGNFSTLAPGIGINIRLARGFLLREAGALRRVDAVLALENCADQPIFDQAGLPQPGRTLRLQARFW